MSGNLRSTSGMFSWAITVSEGSKPRSVVFTDSNSRRITEEAIKRQMEIATFPRTGLRAVLL